MNIHEQLWIIFRAEIEDTAAKAIAGTPIWLQDQVKKFQFGDVVQIVDFAPTYPTVDTTKQIVTQASVKQTSNRFVVIKAAKGTAPSLTALSTVELNALISYLDKIKFAGTQTSVISLASDKIKIDVDVTYDGQYIQTDVKTAVIAAIESYLESLPFDGVIYLNALTDAIQSVPGVVDILFNDVITRIDGVTITGNQVTNLVTGGAWLETTYETSAGYIIGETTGGHTLNDTVNLILA